jgi:hypothetical protein
LFFLPKAGLIVGGVGIGKAFSSFKERKKKAYYDSIENI